MTPTTPAVAAMGSPARRPRLAGLVHHGRLILLLAILIATINNGLERAARDNARAQQMDRLLERVRALEQRARAVPTWSARHKDTVWTDHNGKAALRAAAGAVCAGSAEGATARVEKTGTQMRRIEEDVITVTSAPDTLVTYHCL